MNTDRLAKLYDALTPAERVPLILAARQRGDATEESRLVRSAPCRLTRRFDFRDLETNLETVAARYVARQLELLCHFHQVAAPDVDSDEPLPPAARVVAYLLTTNAADWKDLCGELGIDPDFLTADIPGSATVQRQLSLMEFIACDRDTATAFFAKGAAESRTAPSAEDVAGGLQQAIGI